MVMRMLLMNWRNLELIICNLNILIMKRFCIISLLSTICLSSLAVTSWPTSHSVSYSCIETFSLDTNRVKDDDGWILVGEVELIAWQTPNIKANLYIREIAHSVIYRIEYGGKYYAVKTETYGNGEHKHYATINDITYRIDY